MTIVDFNQWRGDAPRPEIDYPTLTAHALSWSLDILKTWLPGGVVKGREYVCANTNGGKGNSCSTNILTGAGSDFASGEAWGDLIDMVSKVDRVPMHEAAEKIAKHIGADLTKPLPPLPSITTPSPEEKYHVGRENAKRLLEAAVPCPPTHEYLSRKGVKAATGVLLHEPTGNLLIPFYDEHGQFWSVQRIFPDGTKKINDGGKLSGNFYLFVGHTDAVYLAEGYATAATVHELTGATVAMGISSGNLPNVAEVLSRMYPSSALIVAGDADDAGRKAVAKVQERISRFRATFPPIEGQDWNDYGITNPTMAKTILAVSVREPMLVDVKDVDLSPPRFLVKDAIETPGTGMVIGKTKSGKSFFILDISLHCALGKPWLGKEVKEGLVIYICGEGRHGIPRRVKAWEHVHGEIPRGRFIMSQRRILFERDSICEMIGEINHLADLHGTPVLVVVDTMARALPLGAKENSGEDAGEFINACDDLQRKYNCVVLIVHHVGYGEGAQGRARGHSSIPGAMDLEILLDKEKGIIEWTKTKDIEPHLPIKYKLSKIQYGFGKFDASCVLEYDIHYDPTTEMMTKPAKVGAKTLAMLCHKLGTTQISVDVWRDEFYAAYEGAINTKRSAFHRAQNDLISIRYISISPSRTVTVLAENLYQDSIENAMFGHLLGKHSNNQPLQGVAKEDL